MSRQRPLLKRRRPLLLSSFSGSNPYCLGGSTPLLRSRREYVDHLKRERGRGRRFVGTGSNRRFRMLTKGKLWFFTSYSILFFARFLLICHFTAFVFFVLLLFFFYSLFCSLFCSLSLFTPLLLFISCLLTSFLILSPPLSCHVLIVPHLPLLSFLT